MTELPSTLATAVVARIRADHVDCDRRACVLRRVWAEDVAEILAAAEAIRASTGDRAAEAAR